MAPVGNSSQTMLAASLFLSIYAFHVVVEERGRGGWLEEGEREEETLD